MLSPNIQSWRDFNHTFKMEFGWKDDAPGATENDENVDGVGMTDLADERMKYPKSTSNSNQNVVCYWVTSCS